MHFAIEENGWVLISTPDQWFPEWLDPNHPNGIKWANERQYRADLGIGYCQRCFKDEGKSKYFKRYKKTVLNQILFNFIVKNRKNAQIWKNSPLRGLCDRTDLQK